MSISNAWDALSELQKIANKSVTLQAELQHWGDQVIQFEVKGGENCYVTVHKGRVFLERGTAEKPSLTFTALDGHLVQLITGETDYTSLEILGSISYTGTAHDKNTFIGILGLFMDVLLGEMDGLEFED